MKEKMYIEVNKEDHMEIAKLLRENKFLFTRGSLPMSFMIKDSVYKYMRLNKDNINENDAIDFVVEDLEGDIQKSIYAIVKGMIKYEISDRKDSEKKEDE